MNKLLIAFLILWLPGLVLAAEGEPKLTPAPINKGDKVSLQRGAQIFVNHCLGCHSAKYMRYSRVAHDLDIPDDIMKKNLMFTSDNIGSPMESSMPPELAKKWFGVAPPDLTLETRYRGTDWVYSYLTGFYKDDTRPWHVNNHVFPGVAMPWVLSNMQKKMSDRDFKEAMADLTNFMVYMGDPNRAERERIGVWVLIFLAIFAIPVYFLNREYWKDIH